MSAAVASDVESQLTNAVSFEEHQEAGEGAGEDEGVEVEAVTNGDGGNQEQGTSKPVKRKRKKKNEPAALLSSFLRSTGVEEQEAAVLTAAFMTKHKMPNDSSTGSDAGSSSVNNSSSASAGEESEDKKMKKEEKEATKAKEAQRKSKEGPLANLVSSNTSTGENTASDEELAMAVARKANNDGDDSSLSVSMGNSSRSGFEEDRSDNGSGSRSDGDGSKSSGTAEIIRALRRKERKYERERDVNEGAGATRSGGSDNDNNSNNDSSRRGRRNRGRRNRDRAQSGTPGVVHSSSGRRGSQATLVVEAESMPATHKLMWADKKCRLYVIGILALCCVGGAIGGAMIAMSSGGSGGGGGDDEQQRVVELPPSGPEVPTPSPTVSPAPTRDFSAEREFLAKYTPVELLETPGTPENKAIFWLSHDDQLDHVVNDLHYLERYAMTVFYFATAEADDHPEVTRNGAGWFDMERMLDPNLDTCEWHHGIVCREHGGTLLIESIDFSRNGLAGTLPPEMGLFAGLHTLRLTKNEIHGTLPSKMGNLKNLETLDLGLNLFEGSLPPELGQLTQLLHFQVPQNKFVSSIPETFFDFMVHLHTLDVSHNSFDGSLSSGIENMAFLHTLDLRHNKFGGSLPTSLASLVELAFIHLDENRFSGSFFLTSDFLSHHQEVTASHNLFTGTIPGLHSSRATNETLLVDDSSRLQVLDVEEKLRVLDLSFNRLFGSISGGIDHIPNVRHVDLRHNNLEGKLPTSLFTSAQYLEYINLSENRFTGTIPVLGNEERTHTIDLHSNQLTGGVPAHLFLPKLVYLDVSENGKLGGELPMEAIGASTDLRQFKARRVGLTGPITSKFFANLDQLDTLDLGHNLKDGTIPTEIGLLTGLIELRLDNNKLLGTMPSEIGKLAHVHIIDVHRNSLEGTIPKEILNCDELEELVIHNNKFTGPLPARICSALPDLHTLAVDDTVSCTCCDVRSREDSPGDF